MRKEQSRREQFSHGSVSTMLPPSVSGNQGSLIMQEQDSSSSVSIDLEPHMRQLSMQQVAVRDDTVCYSIFIQYEFCKYINFYSHNNIFIGFLSSVAS